MAVLALTVAGDGLSPLWSFESLIAPPAEVPVTSFDERMTGITAAMLATAAGPAHVMADLDRRLTAPSYRLVAHHAPTEAGLIAHQRRHCPVLAAVPLLDTVRLARALYPELPSHRLDDLVRYLRVEPPARRHRAMPDVRATARIFERLVAEGGRAGRWRTLLDLDRVGGLAPKRLPSSAGAQAGLF
uniref:DNA polymerase III epsilon subunit-related protein MSMEG4261 n=1 Tax=Nonomuraea gerenzanensis TaxID=93944 RepID=A0A1M4E642_9ACTN|nr:DNA polymerase III epsilon subunit-related protein MSMEG4261 [Nonomuraea gerenzanensis]